MRGRKCGARLLGRSPRPLLPDVTDNPPPRYHALDALRAAMMLLGLLLHAALAYTVTPTGDVWPYKDADTFLGFDAFCLFVHAFRMPLFFLLAGFFGALLYRKRGAAGLLRNRLLRIGVPMLLFWPVLFPLTNAGAFYERAGLSARGLEEVFRSGAMWSDAGPQHLWFLEYLLCYYPAAVLVSAVWERVPSATRARASQVFRGLLRSPRRSLWLALPTWLLLLPMRTGGLDSPGSWVPRPHILAAYALFFGFGWALFAQPDLLPSLRKGCERALAGGLALLPVHGLCYLGGMLLSGSAGLACRLGSWAALAVLCWQLCIGCIGLCLKYLDRPDPKVRYLADASYWLYLAHLPLMVWMPMLLAPLRAVAPVKYLLVLVGTVPPLLVSYHVLVRGTPVGWLLGGRRGAGRED